MPPPRGIPRRYGDTNLYTWLFSLLKDNSYSFMKLKLQTSSGDYFVWHFVFCFHSTWFLSILAEFGRFCWCDFGRIDFWRVKRRQMRLSWKFSLINRYFSTTLLYQILFLMILFFKHIFLSILAEFGGFCWCDFGR